jgi:serine/threonine protein kinase
MPANALSEDLLDNLGEEFVQRLRRGESPAISEYASKYSPEQAEEIEEFLQSIAMLEDLKASDEPATRTSNAMPETFGRYRIERILGEGGMGAVYLAHDSQLNRRVALKTPKFSKNSNSNLIDRFYREARSAATLQHPNICPVYDVGEINGIHYISMAYIEGSPLSDYIRSQKLPPVASAVGVVRKVALALHEAHAQGVVHRDLKPANIMIDRHNQPIVMDFGLARQFGIDESEELDLERRETIAMSATTNVEARLTQDGTLIGSPGYMSPEQILGKHGLIGPASDVYALGVVLYELLTGELPFRGDGSFMSMVAAVVANDPPDASALRSELAPGITAICRKAMGKEVEDRYLSMQDFATALNGFLKSDNVGKPSSRIPEVGEHERSPELVRAKEQCELARSLYQEGQFAAALSIFEKMVAGTDAANRYTNWARSELPKVRAKTEEASRGVVATNSASDDDFWNQDFGAAAVATRSNSQGATLATRPQPQKQQSMSGWFYGVVLVSVAVTLLLVVTLIARSFLGERADDQSAAKPETDSRSTPGADTTPDDEASGEGGRGSGSSSVDSQPADDSAKPNDEMRTLPFGNGRRSPIDRLWQFDTDRDGKISKAELNNKRLPQSGPLRRVVDDFDDFDQSPRDGLLDKDEIKSVTRLLSRPIGRVNRGPGGRGGPRP